MPSASSALAFAQSQLGKPYSISSCRCSLSCWALDCSGLICASVNAAGLSFPCTSSFGIAAVVAHYGTAISEQEAIHTPGAIGIENPWGSPSWNGSNGHIVFFDGNGITTTEEMGHAQGCTHGSATGRGFSLWAHFPGLSYGPPPAPPIPDKVHPMYSPPLQLNRVVASLDSPTGGTWLLQEDGAIYSFGHAIYHGGANGKPYFAGHLARRLERRNPTLDHNTGTIYVIVDSQGARYRYPV
jgi:hypothetical protein